MTQTSFCTFRIKEIPPSECDIDDVDSQDFLSDDGSQHHVALVIMDFLSRLVKGNDALSQLPYRMNKNSALRVGIWTLYTGTNNTTNAEVTFFAIENTVDDSIERRIGRNAAKVWRVLRHPGIVSVLESVETANGIYIITESVKILDFTNLSAQTKKWIIYKIAQTLSFVHTANMRLGHISKDNIYIAANGDIKLAAFDFAHSTKEVDDSNAWLLKEVTRRAFAAPELTKDNWNAIKNQPNYAIDSYSFGALIASFFMSVNTEDDLKRTNSLPREILPMYRKLLSPSPTSRLSVANFLEHGTANQGFFKTELITWIDSVDSISIREDRDLTKFIQKYDAVKKDLIEELVKGRILTELIKCFEFSNGGAPVFGLILKVNTDYSYPQDEENPIVSLVIRMFASPDPSIRIILLENLDKLVAELTEKQINDKIFPNLATGFTSPVPLIREQTVRSVLIIIGKLNDRNINGELLRCLGKVQGDSLPGIRTNTTICLGKIARNLGPNSRKKVLVNAFSKSTGDPFHHARHAALLAIAATSDLYDDKDIATRLLPSTCARLIDPEKIVRDQARKTVDSLLKIIQQMTASMPDSQLPVSDAGKKNASTLNEGEAGWSTWAVGAMSGAMGSAVGKLGKNVSSLTVNETEGRPSSAPLPSSASSTRPPSIASTINDVDGEPRPKISTKPTKSSSAKALRPTVASKRSSIAFQVLDQEAAANDDDSWGAFDEIPSGNENTKAKKSPMQPTKRTTSKFNVAVEENDDDSGWGNDDAW